MSIPVQITFRNIEPSAAIEAEIRSKAAHLERFSDRLRSCHVVIETRHRSRKHGTIYNCAIDLDMPKRRITVGRVGRHNHVHEDIYIAIRDAFDAATRQLREHMREMNEAY